MTTPSPRATAITRQRALADTARALSYGPIPRHRLDPAALAVLFELGLVASCRLGLSLNVTQGAGSVVALLARGDLKRAAAYARPKRPAA
jgi:hypothetical protein